MNNKQLQDNIDYCCKVMQQLHMYSPDQLRDNLRRMTRIARDATEERLRQKERDLAWPTIVCLCGSTRFGEAFRKAQLEETLAGKIVLTIGCNMRSDDELFGPMPEEAKTTIKTGLDELHLRKIDLADEVLILNVDGYVGESTRNELEYAKKQGKKIRYLEPHRLRKGAEYLEQREEGLQTQPDVIIPRKREGA